MAVWTLSKMKLTLSLGRPELNIFVTCITDEDGRSRHTTQHSISFNLLSSEFLCFFFMGDPSSSQSFSLTSISHFKLITRDAHARKLSYVINSACCMTLKLLDTKCGSHFLQRWLGQEYGISIYRMIFSKLNAYVKGSVQLDSCKLLSSA